MIGIVDYGVGNVASVSNMLKRLGLESVRVSSSKAVAAVDRLILPGVGAFDAGMQALRRDGELITALEERVLTDRVPFLGICLGMQMLTSGSDEGREPGLGWVSGRAKRFGKDSGLKVPHVGWNSTTSGPGSKLLGGSQTPSRFYYVHSYYVEVDHNDGVTMTAEYGGDFCAGFERENVYGVQFHPEKSHRSGMQLLGNFAGL